MSNRSSESSAISVFYLQNRVLLRRFLTRFLRRSQDIEDIVQETFLRAWNAEKSTSIRSPKAFLFSIARNLALSELAGRSRLITNCATDLSAATALDAVSSAEEDAITAERLAVFYRAAGSLPLQCRRAFLLRKVYGMSHEEIARELNIATSTVEKHLAAGLSRCNEYMQARGHEPVRKHAAGVSSD